ncbi:hypothetical protein GXM_00276 [Nostoc sphaeroides CCNUC1]|uniref:Uncharacterized protein n=1 Tax=Nostoc sphaeroides CCNUC1 TaxID=2653204 RepID=A0A5P8VQT0_9NOSO|nr:hypothetical protein GXM_00276 [Nostoc sphaeroides CCNUC1]
MVFIYLYAYFLLHNLEWEIMVVELGAGDWGLGTGDWELEKILPNT